MDPRIAGFHALFADMRLGLPDFDLIEVSASVGHLFLQALASSDFRHVTKGHNHSQELRLSLTIIFGGHFIRVAA